MLKKLMALATTTAMLGANATAYAISSAKAMVKAMAPSPAEAGKPGDGRDILPSIPPMPPEEKPAPRKAESKKDRNAKAAVHRAGKQRTSAAKKTTKPGSRKATRRHK